jgi:hypothetical protein
MMSSYELAGFVVSFNTGTLCTLYHEMGTDFL